MSENTSMILEGDICASDTLDVTGGDPVIAVEGDVYSGDELSGDIATGMYVGPQGEPGKDGVDGKDGFSPTVSVEQIEGGNRVSITDKDGTQSFDVMNGVGAEGGGVTSWNDLTDKPFGEKIIHQSFASPMNMNFTNGSTSRADYTLSSAVSKAGGFIEGKTYVVSIDGEGYECISVLVSLPSMLGPVQAEELHAVGEHSVSVKYYANMARHYVLAPVVDGGHSVAIYELSETIKTLDEKYIPDTIARKKDIPETPAVPTKVSELENDAGFITKDDIPEGEGGGVTSDWSVNDPEAAGYVKNRTHYSEMVEGVITFDGDLTGKEYYDIGGGTVLVKMSDTPLTIEELLGSTITVKHNIADFGADGDTVIEFISNEDNTVTQQLDESNYMIGVIAEFGAPVIYAIHGDLSSVGVPCPEGTYFVYMTMDEEYGYAHSLSCLNGLQEVVHKIDEKYLPNTIARKKDIPEVPTKVSELENDAGFITKDDIPEVTVPTKVSELNNDVGYITSWNDLPDKPFNYIEPITWDGNVDGKIVVTGKSGVVYVKISDRVFTHEELNGATITYYYRYDDEEGEEGIKFNVSFITRGGNNFYNKDLYQILVVHNSGNVDVEGYSVDMAEAGTGTYFSYISMESYNYTAYPTALIFSQANKQLDEKYLPESVVLESELESKGYQTAEQVTELINNALGVIENGTY